MRRGRGGRSGRRGAGVGACRAAVECVAVEALEGRTLFAQSVWAYPGSDGKLLYKPLPLGDKVQDFSNVGYMGGTAAIPDAPVRVTITEDPADTADDTARIQAAINQVAAMTPDAAGIRGAVLLGPGEWEVATTVRITTSGVVLRGSGQRETILVATGTEKDTTVQIDGGATRSTTGTTRTVVDKYVPVGAISFTVNDAGNFAVGDQVIVHRAATANWIHDLGMDLLDNPWTSRDVDMDRVITRIDGNVITLDGPVTQAIDAKYGGATVYKYNAAGRISNVGVEFIGGRSTFDPAVRSGADYVDENHAEHFIGVDGVINGWVRNVTSEFFGYSCVNMTGPSKWVTVQDSQCLDPVSVVTGGRRYSFNMGDSVSTLWRNLYTRDGRHDFVQGSEVTGPNVVVDSRADKARADTGPHHRYSTGTLWDNVDVNGNAINIQNRGNSGTGHGWAGANQVVWNSEANSFIIQNPPTAWNWAIGNVGSVGTGSPGLGTQGIYDSHGTKVDTRSLFHAQMAEKLAYDGWALREVRVGDADNYAAGDAADAVPVDSAWRTAVQGATGRTSSAFDAVADNQLVPFTFTFGLNAGTRVVGASLSLGFKSAGGATAGDAIYIEETGRTYTWAELGVTAPGASAGAAVIDLSPFLASLQDGKLHVAVSGNTAIDWATLNFQTALAAQPGMVTLAPVADAYVDAANPGANFGTNASLFTKLNGAADTRESFLKFDLSALAGNVANAYVRLVPTAVGYNGTTFGTGVGAISNRVSFVPTDTWTEAGLTWNNRPAADPFFREFLSYVNEPLTFDVTALVRAAQSGDETLSLRLSTYTADDNSQIALASRENGTVAFRPQLVIRTQAATVISGDQSAPGQSDTIRLVRRGAFLDVYRNSTAATLSLDYAATGALAIESLGGDDTVIVDHSGGNPIPGGGLAVDGGTGADVIRVVGGGGDDTFSLAGANLVAIAAGGSFSYTAFEAMELLTGGGNDTLSLGASPAVGTSALSLTVSAAASSKLTLTGGSLPAFTDVFVSTGATLDLRGISQAIDAIDGGGTITNSSTAATTLTLGSADGSGSFAGSINNGPGAISLVKNGSGTITLAGGSNYSGSTTVNTGALRVAHPNALGSTAGATSVEGGTLTGRVELVGSLTVAENFTLDNRTGSGGGNFAPHLLNVSGNNTLTGTLTLVTGGSFWTIASDAGKLTLAGNLDNTATSNTRTLYFRGAGAGEVTGQIRQLNVSLTQVIKEDAGTWTLTGAAGYTGPTTVNGGTLAVSPAGAATGSAVTVNAGTYRMTAPAGAGVFRVAGLTLNNAATASLDPAGSNVLVTPALTVAAGATLDLHDNDAVIDYATGAASPLATIAGRITTAARAADGSVLWTGPGITSSAARARATHQTPGPLTTLGVSEAALYKSRTGQSTFSGVGVDDTAVLIKHTYAADATLDGRVTDKDVDVLYANYQDSRRPNLYTPFVTTRRFADADFTFDGQTDDRDLDLLASAVNPLAPAL